MSERLQCRIWGEATGETWVTTTILIGIKGRLREVAGEESASNSRDVHPWGERSGARWSARGRKRKAL